MDFSESDNFNAKEIAEEAEHLRLVLEQMNEQIALLENDGFAYRIVDIYDEQEVEEYRTEKFRHDVRKRDIALLKSSLSTPYFARMRLRPCKRDARYDVPSMTRARTITDGSDFLGAEEADIYVGAHVVIYKDKIIVYSHNSPLGNKVYDRFENGKIEYGGYEYEVVFRRKFDIRNGKLEAVFQDYSAESGGVVYDKFLAHMLEVKRGDKRLTDIIPTIQANQNAIITRPATENCVVTGCAGCGKTMIILQRLEYLGFNKKAELDNAAVIAPTERYIEHIQPVVDDLMINATKRLTMARFYRELILSLRGIKSSERKILSSAEPIGDDGLPREAVEKCYGDEVKRKLVTALAPVKQSYAERLAAYREQLKRYEADAAWAGSDAVKPRAPVVAIDLKKFSFLPDLGSALTKCKLYLLLTAYCYVLGKTSYDGLLFVDEGQDYFLNEYKLIAECTRAVINVYGDENQQLVKTLGIGDFKKLDALRDMKHYALNENYRNAREITEYVNGLLGMSVTSLGLSGGSVEKIPLNALPDALERIGDDRAAVIYSAFDEAARKELSFVPPDKLYTVAQAKGMEYERVYACGDLSDAEKYVAYTRALAKLYLVN